MKKISAIILACLCTGFVHAQDKEFSTIFYKALSTFKEKKHNAYEGLSPEQIQQQYADDSSKLFNSVAKMLLPDAQLNEMECYRGGYSVRFRTKATNMDAVAAKILANVEYCLQENQIPVIKKIAQPSDKYYVANTIYYNSNDFVISFQWKQNANKDDVYYWISRTTSGDWVPKKEFRETARIPTPDFSGTTGSTAAKLGTGASASAYKMYIFQSECSAQGKTFKVISRVSANIAKHDLEALRAEAARTISRNGWSLNTAIKYLGVQEDVRISGTPGRDYAVSDASLID